MTGYIVTWADKWGETQMERIEAESADEAGKVFVDNRIWPNDTFAVEVTVAEVIEDRMDIVVQHTAANQPKPRDD
jgi:hypothetical protein